MAFEILKFLELSCVENYLFQTKSLSKRCTNLNKLSILLLEKRLFLL